MKSTVPNHAPDERKKIILIILVTIALAAIIVALIFNLTGGNRETADQKVPDQTGTETQSASESDADGASPDMQTQIDALIDDYRTAFASADIDALKTIYNTDEVMNSDVITATAQIITGYENTACYIKDGMDDTSKVVFIYDDLKIDGIDTLLPNISYVYVRQKDDGSYYIYPGEYDPASADYVYGSDIQKYISELIKNEDIRALYSDVNDRMAAVIEEDPQVKAFVDELTQSAGESETASSDTSETQSPASKDASSETASLPETASSEDAGANSTDAPAGSESA